MSFWEVHAARRCLRRWRLYGRLAGLGREEDGVDATLSAAFRWWRGMALHYRRQRALGEDHWQRQQLAEAFGCWANRLGRRSDGKAGGDGAGGVAAALHSWVGGTRQSCFDAWRRWAWVLSQMHCCCRWWELAGPAVPGPSCQPGLAMPPSSGMLFSSTSTNHPKQQGHRRQPRAPGPGTDPRLARARQPQPGRLARARARAGARGCSGAGHRLAPRSARAGGGVAAVAARARGAPPALPAPPVRLRAPRVRHPAARAAVLARLGSHCARQAAARAGQARCDGAVAAAQVGGGGLLGWV
jgi:hypothetical protein